jgi:hypothetical protein
MAPETVAEAEREALSPETEEPPTLEELIRHCGMTAGSDRYAGTCTDGWIASCEFGLLLEVAHPEDRPAMRRYRKLRTAHPDFRRREFDVLKPTMHRKVIAAWREAERKIPKQAGAASAAPTEPIPWCTCDGCKFQRSHATPASTGPVSTLPIERNCQVCGKSLEGRRADVKACSKWCRRALARWNKADEAEQREA